MLEFRDVSRVFDAGHVKTTAVDRVTFQVRKGDFVSLTGPSGSGKSTVCALAGLLDRPTSGDIAFDGCSTVKASASDLARIRRDAIGFIFQAFHLIPHLTIEQNVALALGGRRVSGGVRADLVHEALDRVGLLSRAKHIPAQLSGGQQQRAAIARAIVKQPKLLVCDEPTGNLDSENGGRVMDWLDELHAQGATIFVVTHNPDLAARSRRVFSMRDGRLSTNS